MKNILITLAFLSFINVQSQILDADASGLDLEIYRSGVALKSSDFKGEIIGTRFYNEEFVMGSIQVNELSQGFFLKYDIFSDAFLYATSKDNETENYLARKPEIIVKMNGQTFKYYNFNNEFSGYYEFLGAISPDKNLVLKHLKQLVEAQDNFESGYASQSNKTRLTTSKKFYVIDKNKDLKEVDNHKKRVLKFISNDNDAKKVKAFIKKEKLDFEDDGKGLIKTLSFYYSL